MEQPKRSFFQRHPGFDAYSLFWLVLFLLLAALGRFFLPLLIPAGVVLVSCIHRMEIITQVSALRLLTHLLFCVSRQVQCLKHINSMKR